MSVKARTVLTGLASRVPGVMPLYRRYAFRPHPATPKSSHGIWLKHLVHARAAGMARMPEVVAELGPGLSLGVGLAALICGAERYAALDILPFAKLSGVLEDFDGLVALLQARARPDNASGFPNYEQALDAAGFPTTLPPDARWAALLDPERLRRLRDDLVEFVDSGGRVHKRIAYLAPWHLDQVREFGRVDLLFSHTVLQHVQSPASTWADMARLLGPGGWCTHQINFDSHGTARLWNGHWGASETLWRLALGRKEFLINRQPLSAHLTALSDAGLTLELSLTDKDRSGLERRALAKRWHALSDEDLATRGAFVVARKPA